MMEIEIERTAAEVLLLNVLPDQIAVRLRDDPSHIAEHFDCATVLFADIVGFTSMSSKMEPVELVKMLNVLFSAFDELCEKYDLNKVKTIGDCYMAADVPDVKHEETGCSRICHFALDLLDAVKLFNLQHDEHNLNVRIGINTGPVVGGVVGTKRFLFDLWGDAVNVASRMESTGIPGRIQVTKSVVGIAGESFSFEYRGVIPVKGKGSIETFLLSSRTHIPRLRRASFYKQLQRLKSFRDRDNNKFAFRGKSMHLDLENSLAALSLINNMEDSETEAMLENVSEGGYGIEDIASVLSSRRGGGSHSAPGSSRGSDHSQLSSGSASAGAGAAVALSSFEKGGGGTASLRGSMGVPVQVDTILRRSSSCLSGAGIRPPGGRRPSVTFSKESSGFCALAHDESLGLHDLFENVEPHSDVISSSLQTKKNHSELDTQKNNKAEEELSTTSCDGAECQTFNRQENSKYAPANSQMISGSFANDDNGDSDDDHQDDCCEDIIASTKTHEALLDSAFAESNPSLHIEDLMMSPLDIDTIK